VYQDVSESGSCRQPGCQVRIESCRGQLRKEAAIVRRKGKVEFGDEMSGDVDADLDR
jgi:hypothetical protein